MATFTGVIQQLDQRVDAVTRAIALEALSRLIQRSPVDTGLFRGSWQVGLDGVNTATGSPDVTGGMTLTSGAGVINQVKAGQSIVISNSVGYAQRLEMGHSAQAPHGMVALTVAEIRQITDLAVSQIGRS